MIYKESNDDINNCHWDCNRSDTWCKPYPNCCYSPDVCEGYNNCEWCHNENSELCNDCYIFKGK